MSEISLKACSKWEEHQKLQRISFMKMDDTLQWNLAQWIDQRSLIAKRMLNCSDDEIYNEAKNVIDQCNEHIKKILGM